MKVGISALDDENSGVGLAMDDEKKIWSWTGDGWCWMMKIFRDGEGILEMVRVE